MSLHNGSHLIEQECVLPSFTVTLLPGYMSLHNGSHLIEQECVLPSFTVTLLPGLCLYIMEVTLLNKSVSFLVSQSPYYRDYVST